MLSSYAPRYFPPSAGEEAKKNNAGTIGTTVDCYEYGTCLTELPFLTSLLGCGMGWNVFFLSLRFAEHTVLNWCSVRLVS